MGFGIFELLKLIGALGFFIFVGFFLTNLLKTLFVMGLGPGSDPEWFPV